MEKQKGRHYERTSGPSKLRINCCIWSTLPFEKFGNGRLKMAANSGQGPNPRNFHFKSQRSCGHYLAKFRRENVRHCTRHHFKSKGEDYFDGIIEKYTKTEKLCLQKPRKRFLGLLIWNYGKERGFVTPRWKILQLFEAQLF